jgi:UDP-glucose:(heptosyl)LPS alpha-1,3-glucosyltransferase
VKGRKKKIAVVIGAFTKLGGAERMAVETCEQFKDEFDFHVICREHDVQLEGVVIHKVKRINFPRSLKRIIFAMQVRSVLKTLDVDLIHTHERIFEADIFSLHGTPPEHWAKEVLGRKRMNLFDLSCAYIESKLINSSRCKVLLPVSKLVEDCYRKYYDLSQKTIQVVHPTVSDEFINPPPSSFDWRERLNTPINAKVVLFIANNYEHKGLDLVMDVIMEILKNKEIYLWVGGRGNIKKYMAKAKIMGISKNVRFLGMIIENLPHLYRSADLFVLPSKFDTFGIVVIEALASGLPVSVSKLTGASCLVKDFKNGIIVDHDSRVELVCNNFEKALSINRSQMLEFNKKILLNNTFFTEIYNNPDIHSETFNA